MTYKPLPGNPPLHYQDMTRSWQIPFVAKNRNIRRNPMNSIRKSLAATAVALAALMVVGTAAPADAGRTVQTNRPIMCC